MKIIFIAFNWTSPKDYDLYKQYKEYINMFKGFHILTADNINDHNYTEDLFKMSDCILTLGTWGTKNQFDKYELEVAKEIGKPIYNEHTIEQYLMENKQP